MTTTEIDLSTDPSDYPELVAIEFDRTVTPQGPLLEVRTILDDGELRIHEVLVNFGFEIAAYALASIKGYRLCDEVILPLHPGQRVRASAKFVRELAAAAEITATRIVAGQTEVRQRVDLDELGVVTRSGAATKGET